MKRAFFLTMILGAALLPAPSARLFGQDADPKQRVRTIRDQAKNGEDGIPAIAPFVGDTDINVRIEAVKALVNIGGPRTLDGLVKATADNDPEVQIRATDGLVNVYLPGYVKTGGLSGTLSRVGTAVRSKFTDTNDQVIEPFVQVRPDVIVALGKLARGGSSLDSRANAARAVGVLRGRAAVPDLVEALRSKDDKLMYESLVAIEKIGDASAAPRISFLLRDLDEKIQAQALEVTGMLRNKEAAPQVRDAFRNARSTKIKRASLGALAMMPEQGDHAIFIQNLTDKDDGVRAAAAEGLGRLQNQQDRVVLDPMLASERAMNARLGVAFALVSLGEMSADRYGPLRYLFNGLDQRMYRNVATAYLVELSRSEGVRRTIYSMLQASNQPGAQNITKDEKIQVCIVLAQSGQADSIPYLETLSKDPDSDVAAEGIRSLRVLRTKLSNAQR